MALPFPRYAVSILLYIGVLILPLSTAAACDPPANITTQAVGHTFIQITWEAMFDDESYRVRWREQGATSWEQEVTIPEYSYVVGTEVFPFIPSCFCLSNCFGLPALSLPNRILVKGLKPCTDYEFQVSRDCQSGAFGNYSSSHFASTLECSNDYFTNQCYSVAQYSDFLTIDCFQLEGLDNCGNHCEGCFGCQNTSDGYEYIEDQSANLTIGESYNFNLLLNSGSDLQDGYVKIWIDFNRDGQFDDATEAAFNSGQIAVFSMTGGSLSVPANAMPGPTRLRVSFRTDAPPLPCEVFNYGKVEDYVVNLVGGCDLSISNFQVQGVTCAGGNDGSVNISLQGGQPPFTFDWSDNSLDGQQNPGGLPVGIYGLIVTDDNNCIAEGSYTVGILSQPIALICGQSVPASDINSSDGVADITFGGGTPPYVFNWTGGGSDQSSSSGLIQIFALAAGNYELTLTDAAGCLEICSFLIQAQGGQSGTTPTFRITPAAHTLPLNGTFSVDILVEDFENLVSAQFSLNWNPAVLQYLAVGNLNSDDFPGLTPSVFNPAAGSLSLSWFNPSLQPTSAPDGSRMFSVSFSAVGAGQSNISFSGQPTPIEVIDGNLESLGLNGVNGQATVLGPNAFCLVTNTNDAGPGSLRAAIECVLGDPQRDHVFFDIPGNGPHTIFLQTKLPNITLPGIVIDGTSQPGNFPMDGKIIVDGSNLTVATNNGLLFLDDDCEIYGLVLRNFPDDGIQVDGGDNIRIGDVNKGNVIMSNGRLASQDTGNGIIFTGNSTNIEIKGNIIGLQVNGSTLASNPEDGIEIRNCSGAIIGGPLPGEGNLISGNGGDGVFLEEASNISVIGNTIGLDASQQLARGNGDDGIDVFTSSNVLIKDNILAASIENGLSIVAGSADVQVLNNYIGTNTTEDSGLKNEFYGILVYQASNVQFGDGASGGNVIAYHDGGLLIQSNSNAVSVRRNRFLCNEPAISLQSGSNNDIPAPLILGASELEITGTATAGAVVDIYISDDSGCPGGDCQGSIYLGTATASGGAWALSAAGFQASLNIGDKITAIATVSNSNSSEFAACVEVVSPCPPLSGALSGPSAICSGESADLTFNFSGGQPPYSFSYTANGMSNTLSSPGNTYSLQVSPAGSTIYELVSFTESGGCAEMPGASLNLIVNNSPVANPPGLLSDCAAGATATFNLSALNNTVNGGSGLSVNWWLDGAATSPVSNPSAHLSGNATVYATVSSAAGCSSSSVPLTLAVYPGLTVSAVQSQAISCNGASDGSISVDVSGGTMPFNYDWNIAALDGTEDPAGLGSGAYQLTVTDSNGCMGMASATLSEPASLVLSCAELSPTSTVGGADGQGQVTFSDGTGPYNLSWDGPVSGSQADAVSPFQITNLPAGAYAVQLSDNNGCETSCGFIINPPDCGISLSLSATDASCFGLSDGAIAVTINNGEEPYNYDWNVDALDGQASPANLPAGSYSLTLTDAIGCATMGSANIEEPGPLPVVIAPADTLSCFNPEVQLNAVLTAGWQYSWNTAEGAIISGANTPTPDVELPGWYFLTVTEQASGCTTSDSIHVTRLDDAPRIDELADNAPSCLGATDGSVAILQASGGAPPYLYSLNGGPYQPEPEFNGLAAGTYIISLIDVNGCDSEAEAIVDSPAAPLEIIGIQPVDTTVIVGNGLELRAEIINAAGPLSFQWAAQPESGFSCQDCPLPIVTPRETTLYMLEVTDTLGCSAIGSVSVNVERGEVTDVMTPNGDGYNDALIFPELEERPEDYPNNELLVFNRWGQMVYRASPYANEWEGFNEKGQPLPEGTYYYIMRLELGGAEVRTGNVVIIR